MKRWFRSNLKRDDSPILEEGIQAAEQANVAEDQAGDGKHESSHVPVVVRHQTSDGESDSQLDVKFYKSFHSDLAAFSDDAARQHWSEFGEREGRAPNRESAFLRHPRVDQLPKDFNPVDYVYLNEDLRANYKDPIASALHFLDNGMFEAREYRLSSAEKDWQSYLQRKRPQTDKGDPRLSWNALGIEQFFFLHGFDDIDFLADFDVPFYAAIARLHHQDAKALRYECYLHFAETGAESLTPIAPGLVFDPSYYRKALRVIREMPSAPLSDASLYRRWLSRHDFEAFPPNANAKLVCQFGTYGCAIEPVDLDVYRLANADLHSLSRDELVEHIFANGLLEQRSSIRIDGSNVAMFTRVARKLEHDEQRDEAEKIYRRLLHFVPGSSIAHERLGVLLRDSGRYADAFTHFDAVIASGQLSKFAFYDAALCCDRLGDLGGNLAALGRGCSAFPEDQAFVRAWQATAERFFADAFGYARTLASIGRIKEAQRHAFEAAAACDLAPTDRAPTRPIRVVAIYANMDIPQCTLYRVEQKVEQLIAAGYEVLVFNWSTDLAAFECAMPSCDAVIFYRIAAFPSATRLINNARSAGLVTFYDIDDLVFDETEFPEPYADYAGQITPEEYVDVCMGVPLFRYALGLCDYAIASTPPLARRMEPFVRKHRAFVHRNALGLRHERAQASWPRRGDSGSVTIFYGSGTKAHKLDFETILLPALEEIDRRFGDTVKIVMVGHRPVSAKSELLSRVTFEPFTANVEDYWALLSRADIALSVLRVTPATDAKSEIKWLEAAMYAIPSVVSATATFEDVIDDGVDGFLARSTEDFIEKIDTLVRDETRRVEMGRAARAKALRDYGMAGLAANLRSMMETVEPVPRHRTRILVVNVFYPPQVIGGATKVVIDNIKDIREAFPEDFEFEVFTTLEGGIQSYALHVAAVDGVRVSAMTAGVYGDRGEPAIDPQAGEVFRSCVERFAPHLIHFHCLQRITAAVTEVAMDMDIPYLITVHDGWWICDRQFLQDADGPAPLYDFDQPFRARANVPVGAYDRPIKLLPSLRGAASILAVSEPFADLYRGSGLTNVRAIANGLPSTFAANNASRMSRATSGKVRIAHIGGTEVHKGFPLLKYAIFAAALNNIEVLVVELAMLPGDEKIEDWNGTSVRFIPRRKPSEIASLYAEIDVLFAPSIWPESFGLVTREAVAAGCWVVASDRGAIGEPVIEGVNGHIVAVDTIDGLVEVLRAIDADPARYRVPPPAVAPLRTSMDQALELAALYRELAADREEQMR